MIDNGAAHSPAGICSFLRYCAHTEHVLNIESSSRSFRGLGNGTKKSFSRTKIRLPIGTELMLDFPVEAVDQDLPINFWLGTS